MNPSISVIIPCYNQGQFLNDAINSLKSQSIKDWECIIVNDGSTDNTAEIAQLIAKSESRVKVINQNNKGLSGARNTGLINAKGEFLQFLDADDLLESDKLKIHLEFLQSNPTISIVFGDARYFTTKNPELRDYGPYAKDKLKAWISELWKKPGSLLKKALSENLFPVNCPLVRRSVFNIVGNWNENLEAHEDWEFWIRCAAANISMEFIDIENTNALIRMHSTSMTYDTPRMLRTAFEMRKNISPIIEEPELRFYNFQRGLQAFKLLNERNILIPLVDFTYLNRSPKIIRAALSFYFRENLVSQRLYKIFKQLTPWPIQKFINKVMNTSPTKSI